jgi:hypothetical protein
MTRRTWIITAKVILTVIGIVLLWFFARWAWSIVVAIQSLEN